MHYSGYRALAPLASAASYPAGAVNVTTTARRLGRRDFVSPPDQVPAGEFVRLMLDGELVAVCEGANPDELNSGRLLRTAECLICFLLYSQRVSVVYKTIAKMPVNGVVIKTLQKGGVTMLATDKKQEIIDSFNCMKVIPVLRKCRLQF